MSRVSGRAALIAWVAWLGLDVFGSLAAAAPPVTFDGVVDTALVFDSARPPQNRISGLTVHHIDRLPLINLLAFGTTVDVRGVQARLVLGAGPSIDALNEPLPALAPPARAWRYFLEAWAGYRLPVGRGLTLSGGLFPSHIGLESFVTKNNWNATHGWLAEMSPFYQAGLRASYPISDRLSVTALWLNGWAQVGQDRAFRSAGTQVAWTTRLITGAFNLYLGPARPGEERGLRAFGNFWAQINSLHWLAFALSIDAGIERRQGDRQNGIWVGTAALIRFVPHRLYAAALRAELYDDRDGRITGTIQRLTEFTVTNELHLGHFLVRLEARIDRANAATLDGRPGRELLVASFIGSF